MSPKDHERLPVPDGANTGCPGDISFRIENCHIPRPDFFFYFYVPGSDNQAAGSADVCSGCPNQARVFPPHCNYIIAYAYF